MYGVRHDHYSIRLLPINRVPNPFNNKCDLRFYCITIPASKDWPHVVPIKDHAPSVPIQSHPPNVPIKDYPPVVPVNRDDQPDTKRQVRPTRAGEKLTDKQKRKSKKMHVIDTLLDLLDRLHYRLAHMLYIKKFV